ncbi:Cephalosporin hydroxylase [Thermoactinomyces sp. DSM 45891]|uniref:CmcI family methyltransferase n=1 Tax=Thermoactinomyces sp. DSM 45891 TaxID=1761907 RepID=UPI0009215318|nr:CmcI family methyltransferase [Thermoactinomyces sp. DSM 45891]SFX75982.1 Cephalosporin hydroxylase [Thermoactinomyces sp. DSM 45891]
MRSQNGQTMDDIKSHFRSKVIRNQDGICTFLDSVILDSDFEHKKNVVSDRILGTYEIASRDRFIDISERLDEVNASDLEFIGRIYSQGVLQCMTWRGEPLFKSVHDFAIYQMLIYERKPATIIEIGTTNTSLNWYKDMTSMFGLGTRIVGIDKRKPSHLSDDIYFIYGDINRIDGLLPPEVIATFPKPWLVIEDAHAHTLKVVDYIAEMLTSGDYLVVEDSINKADIIRTWLQGVESNHFAIDSYYTDFFGVNATSATNSIIVRR